MLQPYAGDAASHKQMAKPATINLDERLIALPAYLIRVGNVNSYDCANKILHLCFLKNLQRPVK